MVPSLVEFQLMDDAFEYVRHIEPSYERQFGKNWFGEDKSRKTVSSSGKQTKKITRVLLF